MSTIDILYWVISLVFAASLATIILKRVSIGLALFALGWVFMTVRDFFIPSETFDFLLHVALTIVFFVQAGVAYRKSLKTKNARR